MVEHSDFIVSPARSPVASLREKSRSNCSSRLRCHRPRQHLVPPRCVSGETACGDTRWRARRPMRDSVRCTPAACTRARCRRKSLRRSRIADDAWARVEGPARPLVVASLPRSDGHIAGSRDRGSPRARSARHATSPERSTFPAESPRFDAVRRAVRPEPSPTGSPRASASAWLDCRARARARRRSRRASA